MNAANETMPRTATFADLLEALNRLYNNPSTCRDYAYAIKKCAIAFQVSALDQIPLDGPASFEARFPRGGFTPTMPFVSYGAYTAWRKKVLAAIRMYFGLIVAQGSERQSNDEWAELLSFVKADLDLRNIAPQRLIPLKILAAEARSRNTQPRELSSEFVANIVEDLKGGRRSALKQAVPLFLKLYDGSENIRSLLPLECPHRVVQFEC